MCVCVGGGDVCVLIGSWRIGCVVTLFSQRHTSNVQCPRPNVHVRRLTCVVCGVVCGVCGVGCGVAVTRTSYTFLYVRFQWRLMIQQ